MTSITYLEMNSPADFIECEIVTSDLTINEVKIKNFALNRHLYILVGESWQWTDKLSWSDTQWKDYAENDNLLTWVAYHQGSIAGYYELQQDADRNVQIAYFGLVPEFIGRGFGRILLSSAIYSAWNVCHAKRVWVHTCTLDHANALTNYLSRGFKIYHSTHV